MKTINVMVPVGPRPVKRATIPNFPIGDHIPKVIHQTFRTRELRPRLSANIDAIRARNPGWEYRFYDDNDVRRYIHQYYGDEYIAYFDAINPRYGAAKADLFRYLLMYREGGVYLDIKSSATRALDEVIEGSDRYLLAHPNAHWDWGAPHVELKRFGGSEFMQWFIVSAPGHPFLKATIETVLRNISRYNPLLHGIGKNAVLRITGPIAYTRAIAPLRGLYPHRIVDSEKDLGLGYSIFPRMHDHEAALGAHYSEADEALVGNDIGTAASAAIRRYLRQLRQRLRDARQGVGPGPAPG